MHSGFVKIAGEVTRPAVYEMLPQETLRDLIEFAGGFGPAAYQTRVRIHRILPPESRSGGTRARVVVDVAPEQMAGGTVPAVPMSAGDSVTVLSVADRLRGYVTVSGNVWVEGQVGFRPGMKLSEAIKLAGRTQAGRVSGSDSGLTHQRRFEPDPAAFCVCGHHGQGEERSHPAGDG